MVQAFGQIACAGDCAETDKGDNQCIFDEVLALVARQ
jgi:hypothetical protein